MLTWKMVYNLTYNPYPDGVYTPAWSVHSKATLLPLPLECTLQPHSEYHRCTLGCHSMDLVKSTPIETHSNATSSAFQMEGTLHCHSYNLVFVHAYTTMPFRGFQIFVYKIASLQCHSMHLNLFTLRNIHSNATSRIALFMPSVEHAN